MSTNKDLPIQGNASSIAINEIPPPAQIKSNLRSKTNFTVAAIDWECRTKISAQTGLAGERIVIEYEKEKLNKLKLYYLAEKVDKVLDGKGYDILSFDENGNEIHIEVKTTKVSATSPFYMSKNEIDYAKLNKATYWLYRICNYKQVSTNVDLYKLSSDELLNSAFTGIQFEVST